jgi:hypothetical protein
MARKLGYTAQKQLLTDQLWDRLWAQTVDLRDGTDNTAMNTYIDDIPTEDCPHLLKAALRKTKPY